MLHTPHAHSIITCGSDQTAVCGEVDVEDLTLVCRDAVDNAEIRAVVEIETSVKISADNSRLVWRIGPTSVNPAKPPTWVEVLWAASQSSAGQGSIR